ncbi:hypothetical protein OAX78_00295 [Planctomycetota bacterium]|nr:hypothetical protein [Planctomycetota bacterium]
MNAHLVTAAVGFVLAGAPALMAQEPEALRQARALKRVEGHAWGDGGAQGEFHALGQQLLALDDEANYQDLLADPNPVTRCLGLYCLVRRGDERSVELLVSVLDRRERFLAFPGGCNGRWFSEGEFAWALLRDTNAIDWGGPSPLVSDEALVPLALRVLADDRCVALFDEATRAVPEDLGWAEACQFAPELSDTERVKALSRVARPQGHGVRLRALLDNTSIDVGGRLAAASALARERGQLAERALLEADLWANMAGGPGLRTAFLATWDESRQQAQRRAALPRPRQAKDALAQRDGFLSSATACPGLLLDVAYLIRGTSSSVRTEAVERVLPLFAELPAWSADAHAPFVLERALRAAVAECAQRWGLSDEDQALVAWCEATLVRLAPYLQ